MQPRNTQQFLSILLLAVISLAHASYLSAEVYLCQARDGQVSFQDKICTDHQAQQIILPIQPQTSLPNNQAQKLKQQRQQRKLQDRHLQMVSKQMRDRERAHNKWRHERKLAREIAGRKQHKCSWVKHKLLYARKRLQLANTPRQRLNTEETINYYNCLKRKYC